MATGFIVRCRWRSLPDLLFLLLQSKLTFLTIWFPWPNSYIAFTGNELAELGMVKTKVEKADAHTDIATLDGRAHKASTRCGL